MRLTFQGHTITKQQFPILEHDPAREAILEPKRLLSPIKIAEHCFLCFFQDVISILNVKDLLREVSQLGSEKGVNPIYETTINGQSLVIAHASVGAPLSATFMDELIALGYHKFIACGGCGVLDGRVALGQAGQYT